MENDDDACSLGTAKSWLSDAERSWSKAQGRHAVELVRLPRPTPIVSRSSSASSAVSTSVPLPYIPVLPCALKGVGDRVLLQHEQQRSCSVALAVASSLSGMLLANDARDEHVVKSDDLQDNLRTNALVRSSTRATFATATTATDNDEDSESVGTSSSSLSVSTISNLEYMEDDNDVGVAEVGFHCFYGGAGDDDDDLASLGGLVIVDSPPITSNHKKSATAYIQKNT